MEWFCAKTDPPTNRRNVIVADGFGGYCVGWYSETTGKWNPCLSMLRCLQCYDVSVIAFDTDIAEWSEIEVD